MPTVRRLLVVGTAAAFLGLVVLETAGALGRGDRGPDPARAGDAQWNLDLIGVREAWAVTRGDDVVVAVIDSGVDTRHPDLRDRVVGSIDCVGAEGDPDRCRAGGDTDPDGHGTHVAGIATATAENGTGVAGVAPEADLVSVRALVTEPCRRRPCGATGQGADVAAGVRWAVGAGAQVVNLSVGVGADIGGSELTEAIDEAWTAGVVVVVAAGNGDDRTDLGDMPVLVVSAVTATETVAPYSEGAGGARWALSAPGGEARAAGGDGCRERDGIFSTLPVPAGESEAYGCLTGTSMAAPHVAGAAALLVATGLSAAETVERLLTTARDLGTDGPDDLYSRRLLDVARAIGP
ncbi:S8 family serine peptidase [Iamia sp.]|uniref:S8 family serine peptidase n=1 Tax=Iamia sp. TaxID=2722710 RepID=UPI002C9D99C5|nr:S8 family serine peptidase [Iamia sp.]HXH56955.1 S8 family serine peptidase [Iamia sp.]